MVTISRPINGICLNPDEYLLDEEGKIKLFESESSARSWLADNGATEEEMEFMKFEEYKAEDFDEEFRR